MTLRAPSSSQGLVLRENQPGGRECRTLNLCDTFSPLSPQTHGRSELEMTGGDPDNGLSSHVAVAFVVLPGQVTHGHSAGTLANKSLVLGAWTW